MKTVQKLALLLVALFVAHGAIAQTKTKSVIETDSTTVVTTVRVIPNFAPKHDLRIGVGSLSLTTLFALDGGWNIDDYYYDFRQDMAMADTYLTPRTFVGNYSLSYTYHDRRWLQYGGTVSFGASTRWRRDAATGEKVENLSRYALAVMPSVRFVWFYREKVQLYSSVSLGVVTDFDDAYIWGDVALVGCSFGRKVFGFVELGGGMIGSARIGLGYHFNAKKK
ncbi:MAG: hypothetical protein IKB90_05225 [Alistipes sp.]|nr:hypothetical protein [Alistipes sp.]